MNVNMLNIGIAGLTICGPIPGDPPYPGIEGYTICGPIPGDPPYPG
jgi:hypothetical protein